MDFNPAVESSIAPVWIKLPELPYNLFHKSTLGEIANSIGKPLKLDCETENQSRAAFAKICVEVDILVKRPASIAIAMRDTYINQKVIYEKHSNILCAL